MGESREKFQVNHLVFDPTPGYFRVLCCRFFGRTVRNLIFFVVGQLHRDFWGLGIARIIMAGDELATAPMSSTMGSTCDGFESRLLR